MAFSKTWDETVPANHTTFDSQPGHVRDSRIAVRERLAFGGVYFPSTHDELAGEYSYLRMANNASPPAAVTGKWHLYVDADGLHLIDPSGTETDLTGDSVQAKTGDWMLSSVTTARTGWTNVSATYAGKFMRVNATPLTTGGADTHTHSPGSYAGPSHTHPGTTAQASYLGGSSSPNAAGAGQVHTHTFTSDAGGTGAVTGTSASANNIPAFVQVVVFQKD